MGAYVSPERVVRNGVLVAFEGEEMTTEEAAKRGLLSTQKSAPGKTPIDKPAPKRSAPKKEASKK